MKWKHKSGNTFNCHKVCSACCFLLRGLWGIMNQCWLVTQVNVNEKFMTSLSWNELLFNRTKFILLLFILILIYNRVLSTFYVVFYLHVFSNFPQSQNYSLGFEVPAHWYMLSSSLQMGLGLLGIFCWRVRTSCCLVVLCFFCFFL